ncbi:MAG: hypothetical protein J5494_01640 [Candidatus Methanomethylophilaceae archaeon]|nr:hypothetical protein [Candidatus Methanomethylophilaceae archaeon]
MSSTSAVMMPSVRCSYAFLRATRIPCLMISEHWHSTWKWSDSSHAPGGTSTPIPLPDGHAAASVQPSPVLASAS